MPLFGQPKQFIGLWEPSAYPQERFTSIPVKTGAPHAYRSILAVRADDILAGDFFEFYAGFETKCLAAHNTMIACKMQVGSDNDDVDGISIGEANGRNITNAPDTINGGNKYESRDRLSCWTADQDYTFRWFNLIVYAASSAAVPGEIMEIPQGYGRAYVKHYR